MLRKQEGRKEGPPGAAGYYGCGGGSSAGARDDGMPLDGSGTRGSLGERFSVAKGWCGTAEGSGFPFIAVARQEALRGS